MLNKIRSMANLKSPDASSKKPLKKPTTIIEKITGNMKKNLLGLGGATTTIDPKVAEVLATANEHGIPEGHEKSGKLLIKINKAKLTEDKLHELDDKYAFIVLKY